MILIDLGIAAALAPAAGLGFVFAAECIAACLPRRRRAAPARPEARAVVLVPAHDEADGIGATLASLRAALGPRDRILVVADNCTDDTAGRARAEGAEVIERREPDRRGKGYALAFGIAHLAEAPPDVLIVVDADCRVAPDALRVLVAAALDTGRPVQARYRFAAPRPSTVSSSISSFAIRVKNEVRPRGLARLGLPCALTGSGMAFPWAVATAAPPAGAHLVEDLAMGIELARRGHPPLACPEALVSSALPATDAAALGQRRRWEHGVLGTQLREGPRLLLDGLRRRSPAQVGMGLDLMVPPLALLLGGLSAAAALGAALALVGGGGATLAVSSLGLAAVLGGVLLAWLRFGLDVLPPRALLGLPGYVAWKLPLYFDFFTRRGQAEWVRTARAPAEAA